MSNTKNKFQPLTPTRVADIGIYEDAINYVFQEEGIHNVAISGAYGAGKSSVIESYKRKHPEKSFLHISLANFTPSSCDRKQQTLDIEKILEGKILNQLIHQIDPKNIPQTNFHIKYPVSKSSILMHIVEILLIGIVFLFIWQFPLWTAYIRINPSLRSWLSWTTVPSAPLLCFGILVVLLIRISYVAISAQKNKNILKRINIQGTAIDLFSDTEDSYFDKYLNEIIYLFENANVDAVIFEDLDRFDVNHIFQRLREVNTLVNNHKMQQNTVPIRFFYLLRDDIFSSKDRTKFFDFIIPIVPIIDGSNAYDQFIVHFEKSGIMELFDRQLLQGISLYIDDMRILKNVCNEFIIYNERIRTISQNADKLLAMIVYKNLFPKDFGLLQLGQGYVYALFNNKAQFIHKVNAEKEKRLAEGKAEIQAVHAKALTWLKELRELYSHFPYVNEDGSFRDQYQTEWEARKALINEWEKDNVNRINRQTQWGPPIEYIDQTLEELTNHKDMEAIFQLSVTNEFGEVQDFREVKTSEYFDLLKYLLREGLIDETYPDLLTYFYENSLSRKDKVFLRSVADQHKLEWAYPLQNAAMVIERLGPRDFQKDAILNFDLFSFLLNNSQTNGDALYRFIQKLQEDRQYDFVLEFFDSNRDTELLIDRLCRWWPLFFWWLLGDSGLSNEQKKHIILLCLYYSSDENIEYINRNCALTDYISNCSDFLQIDNPETDILIRKMKLLNIQFYELDIKNAQYDLWQQVYSHRLYKLNWFMICAILENCYKLPKNGKYMHQNLTLIRSKPNEPLVAYVEANMNEYFEEMLSRCDGCITDNRKTITHVLNHPQLSQENKERYHKFIKKTIN